MDFEFNKKIETGKWQQRKMKCKVKSEENEKNGMQIGNRPFSTISSMVG